MTPGPMVESDQEVEERLGMTLEQARDVTAMTYMSVYIRLMARELGVTVTNEDLQAASLAPVVDALNGGAEVAFALFVGHRDTADKALDKLRAVVEGIPRR